MGLRLAKCREEGRLERITFVVACWRSCEDSFNLSGCSIVQRGNDIIKFGVVNRDPFCVELRLDTGKPHLWLVGPELREFE